MTTPRAPSVSKREMTMHRLVTPTARMFAATIILITGTGIAAIFWKMPNGNETHDLYHAGIVNKALTATPLPSESVAMLSEKERGQMILPMANISPATDSGMGKYTQVYQPPVLAIRNSETLQTDTSSIEGGQSFTPVVPQKIEPMRRIVDEKPISAEPINKEFPPKPTSVSTSEKNDEMLSMFHFAENSRTNFDMSEEPEPPADPFPIAVTIPALQQLKPIQLERLSPLRPLPESDFQPFSALVIQ